MKATYEKPYGPQLDYLTRDLAEEDKAELLAALDNRKHSKRRGLMKHNPPASNKPGAIGWRALALAMCPSRVSIGYLLCASLEEKMAFKRLGDWVEANARWIVDNLQEPLEFNLY